MIRRVRLTQLTRSLNAAVCNTRDQRAIGLDSRSGILVVCAVPQILPAEEQDRWLTEHIPHRMLAVLPGLTLPPPWDEAVRFPAWGVIDPTERSANFSIWEGRLTAMRWLIMLIGIADTHKKTGEVMRPRIYDEQTDVMLDRFDGGRLMDLTTAKARRLSEIWKGCSQATSHPTQDTNHPLVRTPELSETVPLVLEQLQVTVYAAKGRSLFTDSITAWKTWVPWKDRAPPRV